MDVFLWNFHTYVSLKNPIFELNFHIHTPVTQIIFFSVAEQILALLMMPRLLGEQTCRVVKGKSDNSMDDGHADGNPVSKSWKASSQEVLDSFIYHQGVSF